MSTPNSRSLLGRLWARLIPAGTPVLVAPVDVPDLTQVVDLELWEASDNAYHGKAPMPPIVYPPRPHITDQADEYDTDPRIVERGPLLVVFADGRALRRPSQLATWRLYRNTRPLGPYWYRLDTALGHLLGLPQTNPQLPAEEAPHA